MPKQKSDRGVPLSAEMSGKAALDELYGRLVPIHYALMAGPFGDKDVERWVRTELGKLLNEIDDALKQAGA